MELRIDKRDLDFVLYEQLNLDRVLEFEQFRDFALEDFQMVLSEGIKFATEQVAPINAIGDEKGTRFKDGVVTLPEEFVDVYKKYCANGWVSVAQSPEFGGQGLPYTLAVAVMEAFVAASSSFMFVPGLGVSAAHLIEAFGTDEQRKLYVEKMYGGKWGGTMCLTEPQAGSAVGDLSTSAQPVEGEDYYHITGNKLFISAGDSQLTENVIHLVLARCAGDPEGIKGISLFIVPKIRVDAKGKLGELNDMAVTGVEHKMGINASATCALSFGDNGNCRGWLVGERRQGIIYMFQMMNEARLITGLQGEAIGNVAYQTALAYAKERKQGPKVTDRNKDAKAVAIIEHPDVRRTLMTMKAYGEGLRALLLSAAMRADVHKHSKDEAERAHAIDLLELLTPICKAFSSDIGFKMTELAIQVHGGYGYIKEYAVEQYMRDVKIASLYEGTNGIQALDLLGRKMRMKNGGLFLRWLQDTNQFLTSLKEHPLSALAGEVEKAKNALGEAAFSFASSGKKDPEYPILHASPFLTMFGHVECARLLLEQAVIALRKLGEIWERAGVDADDADARSQLMGTNDEARFYENKIKTAAFFIYQLLPHTRSYLSALKSGDRSALEVQL